MSRQYNQIEIEILARVCSQNVQGSGHYTQTPPLGASNGIIISTSVSECMCMSERERASAMTHHLGTRVRVRITVSQFHARTVVFFFGFCSSVLWHVRKNCIKSQSSDPENRRKREQNNRKIQFLYTETRMSVTRISS